MKLAGKFNPLLAKGKAALMNAAMDPTLSTLGAGAAAAGLATLGNVVTGQAQEKSPGRLIAEALGAGALGAGVGATLGEDPERYGSSNTLMARTATPTLQYM